MLVLKANLPLPVGNRGLGYFTQAGFRVLHALIETCFFSFSLVDLTAKKETGSGEEEGCEDSDGDPGGHTRRQTGGERQHRDYSAHHAYASSIL